MTKKVYIKVDSQNYLPAIRRYLKFVFNSESSVLENNKTLDDSIILIDEEASIDKDWLDSFNKYSNQKIIVFGLSRNSNKSYVNLLDFAHFKSNIQSAINQKITTVSPILLLKNVEEKIRLLFKSHGEKSIFDLLNITRQAIVSGTDLIKQDKIKWKEYQVSYLNPGLENWEGFKKRLRKHVSYLNVCGFNNELNAINCNIDKFQVYLDKLKLMEKGKVKILNDDIIKKNTDCLNQIDHILSQIKQKIDSIYNAE